MSTTESDRDLQRVFFLLKDVLTSEVKSKFGLVRELKRKYHLKDGDENLVISWLLGMVNDENYELKAFECCAVNRDTGRLKII
jgi:hypothetical protein